LPKVAIGIDMVRETLITVEQVAGYLSVDKFTVYRLIAQKEMPAFKVGNQWRFRKSLIDAWLIRNSNVQRKKDH
jgi:excisionase family DNA binding protein